MTFLMITAFLMTQTPAAPPAPPPAPLDPPSTVPSETVVEPPPEPVRVMALSNILSRAIGHNRGMREAGIKVKISRAQADMANAMFDTQVTSNLNFVSQTSEFLPGQFFAVTALTQYSFDAQVSRLLPTGGVLGLKLTSKRTDQTMTVAMSGTPQELETQTFENSFSFVFMHPLLAGFGSDVTTAALKKARIQADADRLSREAKAQTLVRDLVITYWNLWLLWQEKDLLETSLKIARSQLDLTKSLLTVGHAKASDLKAVENAVAQREGDLLLSRNRILQLSMSLLTQLDLPLTEGPVLVRPADRDLAFVPRNLPTDILEVTIKRSKDLAVLEKQLQILRQEEKVARQGLLPKLNLTLTAGPTSSSNEFSQSLENLFKFNSFMVAGGLSFSWSAERSQAKAQLELLNLSEHNLKLMKENISQGLIMGAMIARDTVKTAQKRIELAKVAVESAEAHLKLENDLFALGRGTNHSVLLRMAELDVARMSLLKAIYDYHTSWVQLIALSGGILEEYQLQLSNE